MDQNVKNILNDYINNLKVKDWRMRRFLYILHSSNTEPGLAYNTGYKTR